jgi:mRNA-degrading endonuclease RelE of RelBE toxin-antitoxin system
MNRGRKPASPSEPPAKKEERLEPKAPAFEIKFTADAAAEIQSLYGSIRKQLKNVLEKKLAVNPEGYGLPLRGILTNYWKHEFASHRVIYRIYPDLKVVAVCAVGSRKQGDTDDIYNQLEAVAKTGRLAEQIASVFKKILPSK